MDRFLSINVLLGINTCYLVSFRGYGRLILQKYDVFNSIQFILIVFWGKAWLCLPPKVTWHEYSNGIGSEFFASPPDASAPIYGGYEGVTALPKCVVVWHSLALQWLWCNINVKQTNWSCLRRNFKGTKRSFCAANWI